MKRKLKFFIYGFLYRSSLVGVRFGRIYDCGKCNNENPFDSHTISNILVFHNR